MFTFDIHTISTAFKTPVHQAIAMFGKTLEQLTLTVIHWEYKWYDIVSFTLKVDLEVQLSELIRKIGTDLRTVRFSSQESDKRFGGGAEINQNDEDKGNRQKTNQLQDRLSPILEILGVGLQPSLEERLLPCAIISMISVG